MTPVSFRCPGCGTALASATALLPGKLVDCPQCRLLFTPFEDDLRNPRARGDDIALERRWADEVGPGPYPTTSPWFRAPKRYQNLNPFLQAAVIVSGGVLLVGGSMLGMYMSMVADEPGRSPPVAVAPSQPPAVEPGRDDERSPDPRPAPPTPDSNPRPADRSPPPAGGDTLVGDWIGTSEAVSWPVVGPVSALTFRPDGRVVARTGSGLEVESLEGTWTQTSREGETTRLRLDFGTTIDAMVQFTAGDRIRVTVQDGTITFRRP